MMADQERRGRVVLTGRDNDTITCEEPTPIIEREGRAVPCVEVPHSFSSTTLHEMVALSFTYEVSR